MATKIFINLPVQSLDRAVGFFTKLGYTFNAQFTDANATCMIISEDIYAMLLVKDFFKTFTTKEVADATKVTETIIALTADSRAAVDALMEKALAAGAKELKSMDQGFMYQRSFEDPDGHQWETFWMDPAAIK
ncbi:glyoxalase [Corallococcus sp. ZKHCc1 1396]|uniref:Glyoxalase n=1 Tax=Corallococcus soli TaxID=2710757 RepID=A0ABR9PM39_9BACT|nr:MULTISPECIES: VOC family protein [Corallococcus]MBE4748982.1 glyoxalase [Corallococcus soli]MCY1032282.1 VOC family protein [Corallococcus sp. BB11-1]RYZ31956.1 MAG: glyoxalase [Myxococcaceae bacterium]